MCSSDLGSAVEIETRAGAGTVVLSVLDRGPGIPAGDAERMLQPFTRLDPSRTGGSGSGLGLAIVDRIARMHGGTVALLPRDCSVRSLRTVSADFRPRHAAVRREYRYTIWTGPRSPLRDRFVWWHRDRLDVVAMAKAAEVFVGRHDFSAFGGRDRQPVRTVYAVRVRRIGETITIDVVGDSFVRQMVRSIVASLVRVGRGEATSEDLEAAMRSTGRAFAGMVAPPQGLCLRRVVIGRRQTGNGRG